MHSQCITQSRQQVLSYLTQQLIFYNTEHKADGSFMVGATEKDFLMERWSSKNILNRAYTWMDIDFFLCAYNRFPADPVHSSA